MKILMLAFILLLSTPAVASDCSLTAEKKSILISGSPYFVDDLNCRDGISEWTISNRRVLNKKEKAPLLVPVIKKKTPVTVEKEEENEFPTENENPSRGLSFIPGLNEWRTLNSGSTTSPQLAVATTSEAHAGPLSNISQIKSDLACSQQTLDLSLVTSYPGNSVNTDNTPKRLLRQKEWRAAAAWNPTLTNSQINTLENGGASGRCNTETNGEMTPASREFYLGFNTPYSTFETGSKVGTKDCQSRYGIQDMVGNLWEWTSDQLNCPTDIGYTCVGQTSTVDVQNSDMSGFLFDGQNIAGHGPGDRRALGGTYSATTWVLGSTSRQGTTYFNPVLGLPLMADDAGGSVSIATFSSSGHFHGDDYYLDPADDGVRALALGGYWNHGSYSGRWASDWYYYSHSALDSNGARCAVPVR